MSGPVQMNVGSGPTAESEPKQQAMTGRVVGSDGAFGVFAPHSSLLVKQTTRGWLQECLGCEAKSEYVVSTHSWDMHEDSGLLKNGAMDQENLVYALEKSAFLQRCCLKDGRAMTLEISMGGQAGGQQVMEMRKNCGCPVEFLMPVPNNNGEIAGAVPVPCCCMLPEFKGYANNEHFMTAQYVCDSAPFVPKFDYYERGQKLYRLTPPTCMGGCCIACECQTRGCNAVTPFYFVDVNTGKMIDENLPGPDRPQITQVWAGLAKECCTTADTFALKFPENSSPERKAGLLGLCFLIDFTWFEGHTTSSTD